MLQNVKCGAPSVMAAAMRRPVVADAGPLRSEMGQNDRAGWSRPLGHKFDLSALPDAASADVSADGQT
jgi:hypothetical protein